jgi:hypothetical protein
LLTKPADWEVRINDIRKSSGWGRNKTYTVIRELSEARYLMAVQERDKDGQFSIVSYNVYEEPCGEEPDTENPCPENRDTVNREHNKDLGKQKTDKKVNTDSNISSDSDFEEFWAAYPKRPNNPRKKAMAAYVKARKNVSQKQLLDSVRLYAAYMAGENPKFIAMSSTWLNDERWNCDYSKGADVISSHKAITQGPIVGDDDINKLKKVFPGHIGDLERAKKLLAAELTKGVNIDDICLAAEKYSLFCKGPPYEDRRITPSMMEPWLQFKWREMEAYEFCRVGADRIRTVRPVKVGK